MAYFTHTDGRVVRFVSRYHDVNDYQITGPGQEEPRRVRISDDGSVELGYGASLEDADAVRGCQKRELEIFRQWLADHPELRESQPTVR